MHVITGGGSGIGKALAEELANREQQVLIIGRREQPLSEAAAKHAGIDYLAADITSPAGRELIRAHLQNVASISSLVNNAGVIEPIMPITEINEDAWRQLMAINVDAPLFLTQILYEKLTSGRVLNISSGAAHFPVKGWVAYCTSKAALSMLTCCWQLECKDIAFANVMPGIVDTAMQYTARHANNMDEDKIKFFQRLHKKGRLLAPSTVALFLSWLLLDLNITEFGEEEWDIYDRKHHNAWLKPPHEVHAPD